MPARKTVTFKNDANEEKQVSDTNSIDFEECLAEEQQEGLRSVRATVESATRQRMSNITDERERQFRITMNQYANMVNSQDNHDQSPLFRQLRLTIKQNASEMAKKKFENDEEKQKQFIERVESALE